MKQLTIFTHMCIMAVVATEVATARVRPYSRPPRSQPLQCTAETAVQRKEYGSLTDQEKLSYIHSIQCRIQLPSQYPAGVVPAATNRWLDFTATHVNLSLSIRYSGLLVSWHRQFLYLLEDAMKVDCGYLPYLGIPYWNYPLYPEIAYSLTFDGSPTSLGSNGSAADLCVET